MLDKCDFSTTTAKMYKFVFASILSLRLPWTNVILVSLTFYLLVFQVMRLIEACKNNFFFFLVHLKWKYCSCRKLSFPPLAKTMV